MAKEKGNSNPPIRRPNEVTKTVEEPEPSRMAKPEPPTVRVGGERGLDVASLKKMKINELHALGRKFNLDSTTGVKKQDLIFKILEAQAKESGLM